MICYPPAPPEFPWPDTIMRKNRAFDERSPVAVIGGGVIGLSVGWQLARRDVPVAVFERDEAGRGASWVAAGMLAPHSEVGFEEEEFLRLGIESLNQFPRFLDEIEEDGGKRIPLDGRGTLIVGFHRDDTERIRRLYEFREHLGLPVKWLPGSEGREIEPLLSPKISAAIWLPDDGQINNRDLVDALKTALVSRGGVIREHAPVREVIVENGGVKSIRTPEGEFAASSVVIAAGCWSGLIDGIPEGVKPPVRPVKGQIVSLRVTDDFRFEHVVRAPDAYLLPKDDGRLLVGATQEEMGFDVTPTAGPVMRLLERGWEAIPSIYDLPIEGIDVGLRPGSRDNEPLIGPTEIGDLYYATGHYRHGILLAPVTAYALCDMMLEGETPELLAPFRPSRFLKPRGRR
ncbi:MAG: glycine oxidase ThiO [Candidatus Krumholzibacteriota bacterium]|nr:glycine oxidase ThiO [Candidatus Krumholzibacteriota bacterium]